MDAVARAYIVDGYHKYSDDLLGPTDQVVLDHEIRTVRGGRQHEATARQ